jgi:nitrite reductase/ring-hydroxylating ferredoxin subunit
MSRADQPLDATFERESEDVLIEVERLIGLLHSHPDPAVGETTTAVLERIDLIHRTALSRLMGAIQSMGGDAFVNRLTSDPAIRLLLMSYDLLTVDRRTLAEEALDTVRGHLHAHGIDVELLDVLGGVVSIRLHGAPTTGSAAFDGARRDIEVALESGLLGFQELEIRDGSSNGAVAKESAFLPRESLRRVQRPVYREAARMDEVTPGTLSSMLVDGVSVLLARVDDDVFAVRNACGDGPLPLDFSTLDGFELTCSWHGCRYDVRNGHRLDRPDAGRDEMLTVLPSRVRDGVIEVVVGTTPMHVTGSGQ